MSEDTVKNLADILNEIAKLPVEEQKAVAQNVNRFAAGMVAAAEVFNKQRRRTDAKRERILP